MTKGRQVKLVVVAVLVILAVILLIQNTEPVKTKLFLATLEMPRAILLLATLAIGFCAGLVTAGIGKL